MRVARDDNPSGEHGDWALFSPAGNRGLSACVGDNVLAGGIRSHPHEASGADQRPKADEDARNQLGSERMSPAFHENNPQLKRCATAKPRIGMVRPAWNACPSS
jgi:hypothetical protein